MKLKGISEKVLVLEMLSVVTGVIILLLNFLLLAEVFPFLAPIINILGALIAIVPPFFIFYNRYRASKEFEKQFIMFITDLTESIDSGMTLPMALKHSSERDYSVLTPYIKEINSKVDWGIPFEKALTDFAIKVKSIPIKRSVSTIIETYKVGGKVSDTLRAIGRSLIEIDKIKSERTASVQSQIVTSYLIFFVFIFILVILQTFLIPALGAASQSALEDVGGTSVTSILYTQTFINFIVIQGFFAGLATGKMAEGSVVAGFKHSLVLIVIGYTLFSVLAQFQLTLF
jgi:flagellar protein FlaJ